MRKRTKPTEYRSLSKARPEDWPEDFRQTNGNYTNRCATCGLIFRGHKLRNICRKCVRAECRKPRWQEAARAVIHLVGFLLILAALIILCFWVIPLAFQG